MDTWSQKRAWREAQLRSVLSSRAELAKKRTSRIMEHRILQVRFSADSVAKLSLRRLAIRDSVGFLGSSAGAAHDGSAGEWSGSVLLFV